MSDRFKGFLLGQIVACIIWTGVIYNNHYSPRNTITIDTPEGVARIVGKGRYYLMDNFIERN